MKVKIGILILLFSAFGVLNAQWNPGIEASKQLVFEVKNPVNLQTIEDSAGGALLLWQDKIDSITSILRYQTVDVNGKTRLSVDGKRVTSRQFSQEFPISVAGPNRTVYVFWREYSPENSSTVYVQRIHNDGYNHWGDGISVSSFFGEIAGMSASVDSFGTSYISVVEKDTIKNRYTLFVQRVSSAGYIEFPGTGIAVASGNSVITEPSLVPDHQGGVFIFWLETERGKNTIKGYHLNDRGKSFIYKQPIRISPSSYNVLSYKPTRLDNGFIVFTWQTPGKNRNVYFRTMSAKGVLIDDDAKSVGPRTDGLNTSPQLLPFEDSGFVIAWIKEKGSARRICVQRFTFMGKPLWGDGGIYVSEPHGNQFSHSLARGIGSRFMISWLEKIEEQNYTAVFAQMFDGSGVKLWDLSGTPVLLSKDTEKSYLSIISDKTGGLIAFMRQSSKGVHGIFGQRVYHDRSVAGQILNFDAKVSGEEIILSWKTLNETNISGYRLEQFLLGSVNDTTWEELNTVAAKPLPGSNEYNFSFRPTDDGIYFFRLVQIASSGNIQVSDIIKLSYIKNYGDSVVVLQNFPNPFSDSTSINFYLPQSDDVKFEFYNSRIEKVFEENIYSADAGRNNYVFHRKDLPAGVYFFRYTIGKEVGVKKFVIVEKESQ